MRKFVKFVILLYIITVFCCGCVPKTEVIYPDCLVNNITDAELSYNYVVCAQGDVIYYYDDNAIYRYVDGESEFITETDCVVVSMVSVFRGLYYVQKESDAYRLYKFDWEEKTTSVLMEVFGVTKMFTHGEDVFVCGWDYMASGRVWVIREDEEVCINELVKGCETDIYKWGDYVIDVIDDSTQGYIGSIYSNDGWKYFQGNPAYIEVSGVKVGANAYMLTFDGGEKDYSDILENEEEGCATTIEFACVEDEKIYLLYQYGNGPAMYDINSYSFLRVKDAIYAVDVNTQEISLVYDTEDNSEQIAGFSVKRNEMYLVRQDGVYRCDMQGNNEVKIVDGFYKTFVFEECNDNFFIYDASDWSRWKLLLID